MAPYFKSPIGKKLVDRLENWPFYIFCISTIFIVIFSVGAIHNWPPFIKRVSILFACILPTGLIIIQHASTWFKEKKVPKEIIWVLLVCTFGLISSLLSKNLWATSRATVLFIVSGPFVFLATKYFFESKRNQKYFLWMTSLAMLAISLFGFYEHIFIWGIRLFSDNTLPAGALLIVLSASPMMLLNHKKSRLLQLILILTLASSVLVLVLLAKKGPLLGLLTTSCLLCIFFSRRNLKFFLGFVFIAGLLLYYSPTPLSNPKGLIRFKSSVALRAENYSFGFHIFKENPLWGVGTEANLPRHLEDYTIKLSDQISKIEYRRYIKWANTFENIFLTFLVEMGSLFTITYFGGLLYFILGLWKEIRLHSEFDTETRILISVIFGFAIISLTFDTLKFPNLNWLFHSLLGLMANQPITTHKKTLIV